MSRRLPALLLVAISLAACSSGGASRSATAAPTETPDPAAFAIRTASAPPQACMEALVAGRLVQHPASGLGIGLVGSPALPVEWPFGWSARVEAGRVVLLDDTGSIAAREGDQIEMGGGQGSLPGLNAIWFTCGPVTVTKAG
jgi:hypothetical protein